MTKRQSGILRRILNKGAWGLWKMRVERSRSTSYFRGGSTYMISNKEKKSRWGGERD